MIRLAIVRALQVLAVAALLAGLGHLNGWMAATDRQVERASLQAYCDSVALWKAEAARGIRPERRTGHPDWRGSAAKNCPGMRPAGNRQGILDSSQRQLARN